MQKYKLWWQVIVFRGRVDRILHRHLIKKVSGIFPSHALLYLSTVDNENNLLHNLCNIQGYKPMFSSHSNYFVKRTFDLSKIRSSRKIRCVQLKCEPNTFVAFGYSERILYATTVVCLHIKMFWYERVHPQPAKLQKKQRGGVYFWLYGIAYWMLIQQKLPSPMFFLAILPAGLRTKPNIPNVRQLFFATNVYCTSSPN